MSIPHMFIAFEQQIKKVFFSFYLHGCVDANGYSSVGNRGWCDPAAWSDGGQW